MVPNNVCAREKILIVDDNVEEAGKIKALLEAEGYIVFDIARSANLALEMIADKRPSLAILDVSLKGSLTGIHLGKLLKDQHLPFVYLSENSSRETVQIV